jgi:arylsulfatase
MMKPIATLLLIALSVTPVMSAERPNIILIMSDDMGFSDIGCYGGEIKTPNLDRLAANGLRFSQFYNTARCCPTRATLLTGLYAHQAGVGHMMGDYGLPQYQGDLNRNCVTIAEVLRPAGYRTYMSGKWHVTPYKANEVANPDTSNWPLQRGFERFYGTIHGAGSFFDPNSLTRDNQYITPENDPDYKPETFYYTDAISDNAVRYIEDHKREADGQPFFMYVAYTAAHWPMHALPKDIAKYEGKYDDGYTPARAARIKKLKGLGLLPEEWDVVPQVGDWEKVRLKEWESACMEVYAAMVDNMDQGIGRIVDALDDAGQLENTLILYFQDNGGCAEGFGRGRVQGPLERPEKPTLPPMAKDELQTQMVPPQSRDGYPLRRGDGVMPGPPETEVGYGRNWANVSNTPFREYKHWVHEGGISTPLIAHWPKGIKGSNRWFKIPSHLIDLMATCVDLGGAKYPSEKDGKKIIPMEGISLRPAFVGTDLKRGKPIFFEHEGNRAVRDGKWKLVAKGVNGPWELYDMEKDRTEMHDLAAKRPELTSRMVAQYNKWADERGVVPFGSWNKRRSKAGAGPRKTSFKLEAGQRLPAEKAPSIAGREFEVTARVSGLPAKGVIIAQGGSSLGWALSLEGKEVHFSTRNHGTLVKAIAPLPAGEDHTLKATVGKGTITLHAGGRQLAAVRCRPLISEHPIDGLEVGRDEGGLVGDYTAGNRFSGTVESVEVNLR